MRRQLSLLIVGVCGTALALAQGVQVTPAQRPAPPRPQAAPAGPEGDVKLRWVCKQLGLNDQQNQQVEALIAIYNAELEEMSQNPIELMQKLRDKAAEVQAAQDSGNTEQATKLQQELRNMAPGTRAENNFYQALEQYLTDEQKQRLPQARMMAASVGDISMRPIHVLQAAQELGLARDQEKALEKVLAEYRTGETNSRPQDKNATTERLNQLVANVRAILTPAQATAFDAKIADLRTGAPPPAKVILQQDGQLIIPTKEGAPASPPPPPTR